MSSLVQVGLANAVCAAALAALALLIGRWCRRPAVLHTLWLLVLLKLVTPPIAPLPIPVLPAEETAAAPAPTVAESLPAEITTYWIAETAAAPHQEVQPTSAAVPIPPAAERPQPPERFQAAVGHDIPALPAARTTTSTTPQAPPFDWVLFIGVLWLGGAVVWFAWAGRYVWRFGRLLRCARLAPAEVQLQAEVMAARFGFRRCPEVWVIPGLLSPMVWAVWGVRIYFPAGLLERLGEQGRGSLLAHELAHVCRRDHWMRWFEFVVLGLYWWYPLAWFARRRLQAHEEECCDAWVVSVSNPRVYASAILDAVDFLAGAPLPALASGLGGSRLLKQRLVRIMTGGVPRGLSLAGRLAALALAAVVLPLVPTPARSEKKAAEPVTVVVNAVRAEPAPPAEFRNYPIHLLRGNDDIFSLAISPDGKRLASGGGYWDRPGEVRLWDLTSRRQVFAFHEAQGVASVAFSHDGKRLATGGYDHQVKVRELESGKQVFSFTLDGVARAAYSPNGKMLAVATEGKSVRLYDADGGGEVANLQGDLMRFHCVVFSPDSKYVLAGGGNWDQANQSQVTIWDVATHKQTGKLVGHPNPILCVAFSPSGRTIATGAVDQTVRLWDAATLRQKAVLTGHESWVEALTFTSDETLVSGSHDGTVRFWDVVKAEQVATLTGHQPPVRAAALTPDRSLLVTGGGGRGIKLWEVRGRREIADLSTATEGAALPLLRGVDWAPDGKTVALAADKVVQLREPLSGRFRLALAGHEDAVTCVAYNPAGTILASGSPDLTVKLWTPATGKELRTLTGHKGWVYAVVFAPGGKLLASAGYDKTVRLWDPATGRTLQVLEGHTAAVRAIAFAPDGKTLATGSSDHTMRVWDTISGRQLALYRAHAATVRGVAYSADGKTLVSGDEDGMVKFWDASAGPASLKERGSAQGHKGEITSIVFAPGGHLVASTGADGVRLWDAARGKATAHLTGNGSGHSDLVTGVAFSPDGTSMITVGMDRELLRWQGVLPAFRVVRPGGNVQLVPTPRGP
jgi:WD40 repeat protein/beta-lactamase regulating signal transducer with metallopeptidase domain